MRHLTGEPGRVPVRVGVSIGDTLAALHGVIGVLMALRHRDAHGGEGQVVDVALYESVFNVMESLLPEYDAFGVVRERAGSALPGIAPTNAYPCRDGSYVLVAGNGDSIFRRLMQAIGRDDLADDPRFEAQRRPRRASDELDAAIGAWTAQRSRDEVLAVLDAAQVPAGQIYSAADIAARSAIPGARHDRADHGRRRPAAEGAGHRAQAERARPARSRTRHPTWVNTMVICSAAAGRCARTERRCGR